MGNNKTLSEYIVECLIEGGIKQSSSERQERAFVEAINKQIVSINDPITVVFDNKIISGVTGVEKVEGLAPYGKEPYTDVVLKTTSGNINISMKGEHAPSLMGAGAAGIERLVPGWLKTLTPAIVKRMIDSGFKEGDFFSNKNKDVSGMVRKALEKYGGSGDINVYFAGYSDGRVYLANDGEMPPYIGNVSIKESGDGVRITSHIDNPDDTRGVPDMFFKIGERHIKTLFAGTKEMGGPIDMIYVGVAVRYCRSCCWLCCCYRWWSCACCCRSYCSCCCCCC